MNSAFSEQILADKLSKLNSTQQCIETLSHWCIFHRKNAEQVVQTWDKQFHNAQKEQKVPFLYLANDILQNSKRTGSEFVGEFWKVLPAAVKDVTENGDDHGKNTVSRLVDIWEDRRVFGSRARGLKDLMLGSDPLPALELNKKRSRSGSVKIMKRDSRSLKLKLSIGGTAEKIVSAFYPVLNEHPDEDTNLDKCKATIRQLEKMEKDVDVACARVGDPRRASLTEEIQEGEAALKQSIEKIKSVEVDREALVSQLKDALHEQESLLENVRTQLQVAEGQLSQAANMRRRLNNEPVISSPSSSSKLEPNGPSSTNGMKSAAAIAAEVADRLAASTHSQQIMSSVLSTFAAEEAKNANTTSTSSSPSVWPIHEKPIPVPETTTTTTTFVPVHSMPQAVLMHHTPVQNQSPSMHQPQYNIFATSGQQYLQPPSGVMIGLPYNYSTMPPPPPPPPPPQVVNLVRPAPMPPQQQQLAMIQQPVLPPPPPMPQSMVMHQPVQFSMQQPLQPPPPSYRPLQPPNMGFYPHQAQ